MANSKYLKLEEDDERGSLEELTPNAEFLREATPRARSFPTHFLLQTLKLSTLALALFGLYSLSSAVLPPHSSTSASQVSCSCGASISEAMSLDCRYDSLAAAWLPPLCRDDELTAEFDQAGPGLDGSWEYFADKNATQLLTLNEVALLAEKTDGDSDESAAFYVSFRWHIAHCVFYWRKMFRAQEGGVVVERRYMKESHIEHCAHAFLDRADLEEVDTRAVVRFESD